MKLPGGRLQRRRVVSDLATPLERALQDRLTGYCKLESQDTLLLSADGVGVITFDTGVPIVAYHTGTDQGGPTALADMAVSGPYRIELYALTAEDLEPIHATEDLAVPPEMPASRLAGDAELADRTRERAMTVGRASGTIPSTPGAVEAFLADEERIEAIRARAREEAKQRADEWGFD